MIVPTQVARLAPPPDDPDEAAAGSAPDRFDLVAFLHRQRAFSERAFGPKQSCRGVVNHIRKELVEIEHDPGDLSEWVDVVLLALDGAWRAGFSPEQITAQLEATLTRNEGRRWPDWRDVPADQAIEHVRD